MITRQPELEINIMLFHPLHKSLNFKFKKYFNFVNAKPLKMNKKIILIVVLSLIFVLMVYIIYVMNRKMNDSNLKIEKLEKTLQSSNLDYSRLSNSKDSLLRVNEFLAKYKTLTIAMTYRDNVRLPMLFSIGDRVHLKRDSSAAVVSDIIVGGGKHEYYIKYKVLFRNGQEETVVPELVY